MKKTRIFLIVFLILVIMSAGYAMIASDVRINNDVKVHGQTWDVYFDNLNNVSNYDTLALDLNHKTKVNLTLNIKPEEVYEFRVNANNRGTLNAYIKTITINFKEYEDSLSYEITNLDGTEVEIGQNLYMYSTDTYIIKIKYDENNVGDIDLSTSFIVEYGIGTQELPNKVSLIGEIYNLEEEKEALKDLKIIIDEKEITMDEYEYQARSISLGLHEIIIKDEENNEIARGNINLATGLIKRINEENVIVRSPFGEKLYMYLENGSIKYSYEMPEYKVTFDVDDGYLEANDIDVLRYTNRSIDILTKRNIETMECTNEQDITYNNDSKTILINNITKNSSCALTFSDEEICQYDAGTVWNFEYNGTNGSDGSYQKFDVECSGLYKIEAWGASSSAGGKGGYVSGTINLISNDNLYVYVGAEGTSTTGGFNGGGTGRSTTNLGYNYGGGATDIRVFSKRPKEDELLWNSTLGLNSRIMVAAGGGTASAGGISGYNGVPSGYSAQTAYGGTQTAGGTVTNHSCGSYPGTPGTFGIGGNGGDASSGGGVGGGAGYYGGAGSSKLCSGTFPSGGGSSYISGHTGCVAIKAEDSQDPKDDCTTGTTNNDCSIHYSNYKFVDTVMIDGTGYNWTNAKGSSVNQTQPNGTKAAGHTGNGYARITYVGSIPELKYISKENTNESNIYANKDDQITISFMADVKDRIVDGLNLDDIKIYLDDVEVNPDKRISKDIKTTMAMYQLKLNNIEGNGNLTVVISGKNIKSLDNNSANDLIITPGIIIDNEPPQISEITEINNIKNVSGSGANVGDELSIGDEHFYVVSNNSKELVMLAKYNLNAGYTCTNNNNTSCINIENETKVQDPNSYGWENDSLTRSGTIDFSTSAYWLNGSSIKPEYGTAYPLYVYDDNSLVKPYVDDYKEYLENFNVKIEDARLLSYEEMIKLGCTSSNCKNAPSWTYTSTFYFGSAANGTNIWGVNKNSNMSSYSYTYKSLRGIRPAIVLSNNFTKEDTIELKFKVSDNYENSKTLTKNDILVYAGKSLIIPVKQLTHEEVSDGIEYTLRLINVTDSGKLSIVVKGDKINDVAGNQSSSKTLNTRYYILTDNIIDDSCDYEIGQTFNFEYTGSEQNFKPLCNGKYKIELWGGSNNSKGGYVSGEIELSTDDNLYVYVGSSGNSSGNTSLFNTGKGDNGGYPMGGATDIRLVNGTWSSFDSLKSRIMVAAGSGSAAAGGLVGYNGGGTNGGTQTSFGAVQSSSYAKSSFGVANGGCTGGNGYYPGGGATCASGSGGGSSFISGHDGCDAISADSLSATSIIHTGQPIHYSGYYFENTVMIDGLGYNWTNEKENYVGQPQPDGTTTAGHNGNGVARITYLYSSAPRITYSSKENTNQLSNYVTDKDSLVINLVSNYKADEYIDDITKNDIKIYVDGLEINPTKELEKQYSNNKATYILSLSNIEGNGVLSIVIDGTKIHSIINENKSTITTITPGIIVDNEGPKITKTVLNNRIKLRIEDGYGLSGYSVKTIEEIPEEFIEITGTLYEKTYNARFNGLYYIYAKDLAGNVSYICYDLNVNIDSDYDPYFWEYDYTGGEQIFIVPKTGYYKLETWGAQGGNDTLGGYGGYSKGIIELNQGDILYINVGGQGKSDSTTTNIGGYNGGGYSGNNSGQYSYGGGGATHIATSSGLLSTLESKKENIIIVSGGGAGTVNVLTTQAGSGGGYIGGAGTTSNSTYNSNEYLPLGATQLGSGKSYQNTRNGKFGAAIQSNTTCYGGGGGGGYYGGSNGCGTTGSGGSGYIGNENLFYKEMYCFNCDESTDEDTYTVSTDEHSKNALENTAKEGNGYAKISYLQTTTLVKYENNLCDSFGISKGMPFGHLCQPQKEGYIFRGWYLNDLLVTDETIVSDTGIILLKAKWQKYNEDIEKEFEYTGSEQTFEVPKTGYYKLETWGAQGGNDALGGYGGYSKGVIKLNQGDILYINVGGQGKSNSTTTNIGGYNGGGYSGSNSGQYSYGGGGATHIATSSGLLSTLESKKENIIIVSGGGAGTVNVLTTQAGSGGGYIGGVGSSSQSQYNSSTYIPTGATQLGSGKSYQNTRNGKFGAAIQSNTPSCYGGGGGGGYYGGSNGCGTTGSGGSGYIGNNNLFYKEMYCYNCQESNISTIYTISVNNHSISALENTAKEGDGYAKITYLGSYLSLKYKSKSNTNQTQDYANTNDTITVTFEGKSNAGYNDYLTENDISIYVDGILKNPTKTLNKQVINSNEMLYTLSLGNIEGNGSLTIVIDGTKVYNNENVTATMFTIIPNIIIDNNAPSITGEISNNRINLTFEDNYELAGYKITQTNSIPQEFNLLSTKNANLKYSASQKGTYYVYVKDTVGNINYESYIIDTEYFCELDEGTTFEFDYNGTNGADGSVQEFEVPCNGTYMVQLWGAKGSNYSSIIGGYGGYVSGNINLLENEKLFVFVGGQSSSAVGGYNGGGYGYAAGGGGATDIRLYLSDDKLWDDTLSLNSRIMVAGGGGGSNNLYKSARGGAGGGLNGYNGEATYYTSGSYPGGSQISNGYSKFGYGFYGSVCQSPSSKYGSACGGGAGSGYYGGYGGSTGYGSGGGGGSSYISGHTGCVAIKSSDDQDSKTDCVTGTTDNNCSIHYSGYHFEDTVMIDGLGYNWTNIKGDYVGQPQPNGTTTTGHVGNGYARITYLGP